MRQQFLQLLAVMTMLLNGVQGDENSREKLFQTPTFTYAKVSPNGELIAKVGADEKGIPNVFLARKRKPDQFTQITAFETPELIQFFWSGESKRVLVLKDENGEGKLRLYGVDVETGETRFYTERFEGADTKVLQVGRGNRAALAINDRDPRYHDLYILDLDTGEFELLLENSGYAQFLLSESLEVILKMRINEDGSWTVERSDGEIFMELSSEDAFETEFLSYDARRGVVYMLDTRTSDLNHIVQKALTGEEQLLAAPTESDVYEILYIEGEPKAYATYYCQKKWHAIDPAVQDELDYLLEKVGPNFEVASQSRGGAVNILSHNVPDEGTTYWLYDRKSRQLAKIYAPKPSDSYSKMYDMVAETRDGKKLVCYYTLPKEVDRGGRVERPIPLVVFPHGGPFKARDRFEFNPYHQWLASCGYAVLSVNFRLSSGFGKKFVNAGNGQWGGKAHLDVIDAVEACIARQITEREQVAIVGGSYGGYEALAGLTFTPDYFKCAVSICGPSSLKTVLENVPAYWEFTKKPLSDFVAFYTRDAFVTSMGGDPRDPKGADYLKRCSPLHHLKRIQAPLLLVHGRNDHVVKELESRQIFESMKERDLPVTYILFPDEGHRIAKYPNKIATFDAIEKFLAEHLGGRYNPAPPELLKSSSRRVETS